MKRAVQKKVKLGEQLFVSATGKKGTFRLVDGFFHNKLEALRWKERHFPDYFYRIHGLRMDCTRVQPPSRTDQTANESYGFRKAS